MVDEAGERAVGSSGRRVARRERGQALEQPPRVEPPKGAPNVLLIITDDAGFEALLQQARPGLPPARRQVVVAGIEAHVCVMQTVLELLDAGYTVHLVRDAVMSRRKENWMVGIEASRDAGAVITSTEAALFQLLRDTFSDQCGVNLRLANLLNIEVDRHAHHALQR